MRMRGRHPIWAACCVTEKAPVITACEAMTVAAVARNIMNNRAHPGTSRKNGLRMLLRSARTRAPWPR
jgi:hypothetical protein